MAWAISAQSLNKTAEESARCWKFCPEELLGCPIGALAKGQLWIPAVQLKSKRQGKGSCHAIISYADGVFD